jgi:hypothetical protein
MSGHAPERPHMPLTVRGCQQAVLSGCQRNHRKILCREQRRHRMEKYNSSLETHLLGDPRPRGLSLRRGRWSARFEGGSKLYPRWPGLGTESGLGRFRTHVIMTNVLICR